MFRRTLFLAPALLVSPWLALGAATSVQAQQAAAQETRSEETKPAEEVTITATKMATPVTQAPATVSVITSEDIDSEVVNDLKDLVRYEPGVSVRNQVGRFGLTDITIRGIGGNRVLLEVDEVRLPDAFEIGAFSNATRDGVEVDLLKRVEIVRGSSSSLYGSDAIGGVVQFTTKDPVDLLQEGRNFYVGSKLSYDDEEEGYGGTVTLAGRANTLSGLLAYTHRDTGEYAGQGTNTSTGLTRTAPNPQEGESDSVLGKVVLNASETQVLRLTGEYSLSSVNSNVLSGLGVNPLIPSAETTDLRGADEQRRLRVSLEQELRNLNFGVTDRGVWRLYWQDSETTQDTTEARTVTSAITGVSLRRRERTFDYDQRTVGGELTLFKNVALGAVEHLFTYGIEALQTDTEQLRNGQEINLTTGAVSPNITPDNFPVRDFPVSRTRQYAAYLQDEITLGAWTFLPAVRVDRFELDPETDAIFAEDNVGITPTGLTETSVTPRLGLVYAFTDRVSAFGSYAAGFRVPPYTDVNVGFTNVQFGYTTLPNPNLKPETSDSFETGLRFGDGEAFVSLSGFYSTYDDFIESFINTGPGIVGGIPFGVVFQSQNVSEVTIYGAELKAALPLVHLASPLNAFTLRVALSHSVGDNEQRDQPLNSIDPPQAVLGLQYTDPSGRWSTEFITTAVGGKNRIDQTQPSVPFETDPLYAAPGFATFDLLGHFRLGEMTRFDFGVFNLTDKKYWQWADVRGRSVTDPALDRFTRPGRSFAANVRVEW